MISFAHPVAQYRSHKVAIDAAVSRVLEGGSYILGREVDAFECAFANYCGCAYGIGVGSGTDALILALRACGIGPETEVVTVSHTAIATVAAILAVGAMPVLIDVDPTFYTLDAAKLEPALSERTKAILAVHLYGQAADMDAITAVARRHGLIVVEDCAQAAGGAHEGRPLGSLGEVACFSFFPTKNLGAIGDGGMVVTSEAGIAERVRRLRQYGWDDERNTREIGVNSRLDALQAAILAAKLPSLDADNARRAALAARYAERLAGLPVSVPLVRPESRHAFHLYVIACEDRDALQARLAGDGIAAGIHYPMPVHRHPGYSERMRVADELAVTDRLASRILSLPLYPELDDGDVDRIATAIRSHYSG